MPQLLYFEYPRLNVGNRIGEFGDVCGDGENPQILLTPSLLQPRSVARHLAARLTAHPFPNDSSVTIPRRVRRH